jgi:SAM-dependent methyltransferase
MRPVMDPTLRFSSRVENYSKYRPGYPQDVMETLRVECGLDPDAVVADIGSGTGFLSELFLPNGNQVFGVEPNREMRDASVRLLQMHPRFSAVDGRAEATSLPGNSVDFVVAGQSFHWFDRDKCRKEFLRILKPNGWTMIVWNERNLQAAPFMAAYDQLLQKYVTDETRVAHKQVYETALEDFFGANGFASRTYSYRQSFDYEGVKGRLLSSSYTPEAGHPNHIPLLAELSKEFHIHQTGGRVQFEYTTRMYFGRLNIHRQNR